MTTMQGHIQATMAELSFAFGAPLNTKLEKVTTEWHIKFGDGAVASIYDWRESQPPEPTDVIAWHIGGHTAVMVERVHSAFREAAKRLKDGHRKSV